MNRSSFAFANSSLCVFSLSKWPRRLLLCLLLGTILLSPALRAQTTSTLEGTVTDHQGLAISGAEVSVTADTLAVSKKTTTDANGNYQIALLPAGVYTVTVSHDGFSTQVFKGLEITLNRTVRFNASLEVGTVAQRVEVNAEIPLLETTSSSEGATIVPREIVDMPLNGRNYLDLMQLVPGVAINRQSDLNSDNATPVLGERANNTGFLIDGQSNQNELAGGPAAQFNQDTIAEIQVITTGYKAEFGHASGGVVNVITKSGTNSPHGLASIYHRNSAFDSSDIPGSPNVPYLLRWDYDLAGGGAMVRDKAFWFGSAEGIHENRQLNFVPPKNTPQFLINSEETYNEPTTDREARAFVKFDQVLRNHHLTEQMNYTNVHVNSTNPLSAYTALPSTRTNLGDRNLFLGFSDTVTFGSASPFILTVRGQYRDEPTLASPAHPQAGPNTLFNLFSSYSSFSNGMATGPYSIFGDQGQFSYGATLTPSTLGQKYGIFGASLAKTVSRHTLKFGWDFERTHVDGAEANLQFNQLFATQADYVQFGPVDAGFFLLATVGGLTPQANQIKLRNNYDGLWAQDDWKLLHNFTVNGGLRWDYDSAFKKTDNISPRVGFAWSVTPKTVVRGSFGLFYDHFRLGLVRDIPGFGGADIRESQPLSFPRLFYGAPTIAPALFGLCLSQTRTDAQLLTQPDFCIPPKALGPTFPGLPSQFGVDHLSNLGPTPIPANVAVNQSNVQQLSGLSSSAFLNAADAAIGAPNGFWFWGPFGTLSFNVSQPGNFPVTVDPSFATPYSRSYTLGAQRQLASDWVVSLDYYHKDIINILGVRETNLPFAARLNNSGGSLIQVNGFGPWYGGTYDGGVFSFQKRMSRRFTLGGSYAYVSENDDALNSNLGTSAIGGGNGFPTDSFRGTPPVVTDPGITNPQTGQVVCPGGATNATSSFIACNGNFVPRAGVFYNGALLDKGASDFALRNTLEAHGLVELPWKIQFSSLFRAQSGFRYTQGALVPLDQDGNNNFNGRDLKTGRSAFQAPRFVNMDLRAAKTFPISERVRAQVMFEFFNLFNNANPAAINQNQNHPTLLPGEPVFGTVAEYLPGREGQFGLRIEF
ncbi:MAG TPA: TonB-dependent receptor [Candidatus Acidoferrum sp.]|nr:TonB-dependent receptor [Candidatus Acidoferrum sp.]